MELKHSWHSFTNSLGFLQAKKRGLSVLIHNHKILGAATSKAPSDTKISFDDFDYHVEDKESANEVLAHKYQVDAITFIERDDLLSYVHDVSVLKTGKVQPYYVQLMRLRAQLGVDDSEKVKGVIHKGEKPISDFWPRNHFFLDIFNSTFADLLPERKILLLCIYDVEQQTHDVSALEYSGRALKEYHTVDWSSLDWTRDDFDVFQTETAQRLVLWTENTHMLPTYAVFVTKRLWQECIDIQLKSGAHKSWKHFVKHSKQRDLEKELLIEPTPWPMTATLAWHSLKS